MPDILQFHEVGYRYPGGADVPDVLADISFTLRSGEMAFLTGASGAGKSTVLRLAAALAKPGKGQIVMNGQNLGRLRPRQIPAHRQQLGLIFQNFNLLNDRTVHDNVALPLVIRGYAHADIGKRVRAALDQVGLSGKDRAYPLTLAGGEQQRVGIARAIVTKPELLLADEPTGNLDPDMAREVMGIFRRFNEVGVSVLVATHAIDLIRQLPGRIIHLDRGRISQDQPRGHVSGP